MNRLVLVLVGFCFFCVVSLAASDRVLLASGAQIKLPLVNADISYAGFLLLGPMILIGIAFYLHVFVGYWLMLTHAEVSDRLLTHASLPFLFNLKFRGARWLSAFLFYWLVPIVLAGFVWKALPRPEVSSLAFITILTTGTMIVLQLRRLPDQAWLRGSLLVVGLLILVVLQVQMIAAGGTMPVNRKLNLRNSDLSKLDLKDLNLAGANLRGAQLIDANLARSNISRTNLENADLTGADLARSNLRGAQLS
jgi:hypothetical protein